MVPHSESDYHTYEAYYYCGILLFIDPMVAVDGDRIYGYLTDEWNTGLEVELRIGSVFAPEEVVDEIAEYSDFEDQY